MVVGVLLLLFVAIRCSACCLGVWLCWFVLGLCLIAVGLGGLFCWLVCLSDVITAVSVDGCLLIGNSVVGIYCFFGFGFKVMRCCWVGLFGLFPVCLRFASFFICLLLECVAGCLFLW